MHRTAPSRKLRRDAVAPPRKWSIKPRCRRDHARDVVDRRRGGAWLLGPCPRAPRVVAGPHARRARAATLDEWSGRLAGRAALVQQRHRCRASFRIQIWLPCAGRRPRETPRRGVQHQPQGCSRRSQAAAEAGAGGAIDRAVVARASASSASRGRRPRPSRRTARHGATAGWRPRLGMMAANVDARHAEVGTRRSRLHRVGGGASFGAHARRDRAPRGRSRPRSCRRRRARRASRARLRSRRRCRRRRARGA